MSAIRTSRRVQLVSQALSASTRRFRASSFATLSSRAECSVIATIIRYGSDVAKKREVRGGRIGRRGFGITTPYATETTRLGAHGGAFRSRHPAGFSHRPEIRGAAGERLRTAVHI